jgi:ADP-ribose pyrophosphatase
MIKDIKTPPFIQTEILTTTEIKSDFLSIKVNDLKFTYPDGSNANMRVDSVSRNRSDAVVIVAYFYVENTPFVYLRSALRPALAIREYGACWRDEPLSVGNQWELPAGLVELEEIGALGLLAAAARETEEELGFNIEASKLISLGDRGVWTSPGMIAERLFFFAVEVNPIERGVPSEDGSALEKGGIVEAFSVAEIREHIDSGFIRDAKTEIGLLRFINKIQLR